MHLSTEEMERLPFRPYRKVDSFRVRARKLTAEDVRQRAGVIQTLEGPATFQTGDFLARGSRNEEYPISPEAFAAHYDESSQEPDTDGFAWYRPKPLIHQAVQIDEPFTIDTPRGQYTGQRGDYLMRTVGLEDDYRIIARWYFEQNYEPIGNI